MVFLGLEVLVNPGEREKLGAVERAESRPIVSCPSPQGLARVQPTYLLAQALAPRVNYYPQYYLPPLELTLGPSRSTKRLQPLFSSFLGMSERWGGRAEEGPSSTSPVLTETPPFDF